MHCNTIQSTSTPAASGRPFGSSDNCTNRSKHSCPANSGTAPVIIHSGRTQRSSRSSSLFAVRNGTVSTATDAKIVNNSFGAVKVNSVSIEAAQGWSLAAFGDKATLAHEKVNANKFGFQISLGNGEKKLTDSKNASKQTLLDSAVEGCYMSGVGDTSANSIGIAYDAIVTPVSEAVTNTAIASVLFIIAWDAV